MKETSRQYDEVVQKSKEIFFIKSRDYGTAWRVLRPSSLTDQIYIKASRIRSLEEKSTRQVEDPVELEYTGIVNYGIMALIQLNLTPDVELQMDPDQVSKLYDQYMKQTRDLMCQKNHDYGEAWRNMRVSSMTDLILMKILRIKQIEENESKTLISEGVDANYMDIVNYAIFALIKLSEQQQVPENN